MNLFPFPVGLPGWRDIRGCRDRDQWGAAAGAGSSPWAAPFPSPNSGWAHFLPCSASHPWLPPGSWNSMIKVTNPLISGSKWDFSDKTHQCWHSSLCLFWFLVTSTLSPLAELYCGHYFHGFWGLKSNLWEGITGTFPCGFFCIKVQLTLSTTLKDFCIKLKSALVKSKRNSFNG